MRELDRSNATGDAGTGRPSNPPSRSEARARAAAHARTRRLRLKGIRKRVAVGGTALFFASWGAIAVGMASGEDPVHSRATQSGAEQSSAGEGSTSTGSGAGEGSGEGEASEGSSSASSSGNSGSEGTSAVTTGQS